MFYRFFLMGLWAIYSPLTLAWDEQKVLDFITAHNPVLQAHRVVTRYHRPPNTLQQVLEHTSLLFARASAGQGTTLQASDALLTSGTTAGIQFNIPLASRNEQREHALKTLQEMQAIDTIRLQVINELGQLRQHEGDLAATKQRLKYWQDKSMWSQQRVNEGYDNVDGLWDVAKQINEQRAAVDKLALLIKSQRYKVATYAGARQAALLQYLSVGAAPGRELAESTD